MHKLQPQIFRRKKHHITLRHWVNATSIHCQHLLRVQLTSKKSLAREKTAKQWSAISFAVSTSNTGFSSVSDHNDSRKWTKLKGLMSMEVCLDVFIANSATVKYSLQSVPTVLHKLLKVFPNTWFALSTFLFAFDVNEAVWTTWVVPKISWNVFQKFPVNVHLDPTRLFWATHTTELYYYAYVVQCPSPYLFASPLKDISVQ